MERERECKRGSERESLRGKRKGEGGRRKGSYVKYDYERSVESRERDK